MAETRGRFNVVKNRLIDLIVEADISLQPNIERLHVHGDWKRPIPRVYKYPPTVSVRISPINVNEDVYARIFEGPSEVTGSTAEFMFTAHIFTSACTDLDEDRGKYVQDLADKIIDHLLAEAPNQTAFGIEDIYGMSYRESDVGRQPYRLCRVILSGRLDCKRFDA